MTTKEASAFLGITLRTLYRLIDEGGLKAYKFGRVIRLKRHELEEWVEKQTIEPGAISHLYPPSKPQGEVESAHG